VTGRGAEKACVNRLLIWFHELNLIAYRGAMQLLPDGKCAICFKPVDAPKVMVALTYTLKSASSRRYDVPSETRAKISAASICTLTRRGLPYGDNV